MRHTALFAILALSLALPATAQVYRWTDKDGKVHYSSQKPPDVEAKDLGIKSQNTLGAPATTPAADAPAAAPSTAPATPNDGVQKELDALKAQRCNAAKAVAARYENAPFLEAKNPDGSPRRLSVEEEARERVRVKQDIADACGPEGQ
jgi:hypothetical protein